MLVERMQRMLRRSHSDWEGSTTGVGIRAGVPNHVRDLGSAPARGQAWHGGSDPAAARWHGGSDPAGAMFRTPVPGTLAPVAVPHTIGSPEPSTPARATSGFYERAAPRKGRYALVLLGAALAGIAGVAVVMSMTGGEAPRPSSPRATETEPRPAIVDEPRVTQPTEAGGTAAGAAGGTTAPGAGSGSEAGPSDATNVAPEVTPPPEVGKAGKPGKPGKPGGKTGKAGGKKDPGKEPTVEPPKDPVPTGKPACDPFENSHGCPKKPRS